MGDMFSLTSWKDGPKKINPLKQVFLLFIIFASLQPIFAHSEIKEIPVANSTHPVLTENQNPTYNPEEILRESQRNVDRSISILGIVATSMGVLVGLLTIFIIVAIAFGVFEYSRWRSVREDIEKRATESEDNIKQVEGDAKIIRDNRNKIEEYASKYREKLKSLDISLTEKPPKETGEKLDEITSKLEILEMLGASLKPEDYYNRGADLYYKEKYELALTAFEKATELKPDYAIAWDNKGVTLGKLGRHEDALAAHEKAIELKPDHANAWYNKGVAISELDRHEDALAAHEKAIELKPDDASAWYNKGNTLFKLDRHEDALTAYEKAIELKPDHANAWCNKGNTLGELGRYEDALTAYEKAIELKPDHASAWFNKACIYSLKGDKENALTNLSKAIDLDAKYKEDAKKDEDFKELWDDPDFKKIVSNQK